MQKIAYSLPLFAMVLCCVGTFLLTRLDYLHNKYFKPVILTACNPAN